MSAKGDVRLKFVIQTVPANPNSVPCTKLASAKMGYKDKRAYECNIQMYAPIINKPMHERPLRRHHIRVFLRLLHCCFLF